MICTYISQTTYEKSHAHPGYPYVHLRLHQSLGDAHGSGQSLTPLVSDSASVHKALSELESIRFGLATSRRGLLRVRTDSQTKHPGGWHSFHRMDDDCTVSGFLSSPLGNLSSLFPVVGDEVMNVIVSPNQRVATNRRCAFRFWGCRRDLGGYGACVSAAPAAVAHPGRSMQKGLVSFGGVR